MNGVQILGGFLRRERPGARQITGMALPSGASAPLVAVEAGRLAAFVLWEEDRAFRRPLRIILECLTVCHEVWLVTSVTGAQVSQHMLPPEAGIRVTTDEGLHLGVARPASIGRPQVKDLVHLLNDVERMEIGAVLGVSSNPLAVAAAGQLKWGSAPFGVRVCEILGDRAGPAPCLKNPSPEIILRAAQPAAVLATPVRL
jgi:hypothetical protein